MRSLLIFVQHARRFLQCRFSFCIFPPLRSFWSPLKNAFLRGREQEREGGRGCVSFIHKCEHVRGMNRSRFSVCVRFALKKKMLVEFRLKVKLQGRNMLYVCDVCAAVRLPL